MYRLMYRLALLFAVVAATAAPASAQINWNVTYQDVTGGSGVGFDDHTVVGTTTVGQLRQASITAASTTGALSSMAAEQRTSLSIPR